MTEITPLAIRRAAMNFLACREHSFQELSQKLSRRFPDCTFIEEQVCLLAKENLQSDNRFAESFVRSRVLSGQGPLRICNDITQKGISESLVIGVIESQHIDWGEVVGALYSRKYKDTEISDEKEKAKRIRFLRYRGFSFEHIRTVLK